MRHYTAAAIALPMSSVLAFPPTSGVRGPSARHRLDGTHDGRGGVRVAEMLQHHGAGPDLAHGVGDLLP